MSILAEGEVDRYSWVPGHTGEMSDLLEIGSERRRWLSRRARLVLLLIVIGLGTAAVVTERAARERAERDLAACVDDTAQAVELAGRTVHATYEYVRPVLSSSPRPAVEAGLFRLIARSAADVDSDLAGPSRTCSDIAVLLVHDDLRELRDRCVELLEDQQEALDAVAADGAAVIEWQSVPRSC